MAVSRPIGSVLRRRVLALALVLLMVVLSSGAAAYAGHRASDDALRTGQQLQALEALVRGMVESETALRGFFIVGQESFLQPYVEGADVASRSIAELQDALGGDGRLQRIARLREDWQRQFAQPILELLEGNRRDVAADRFASGEGKRRIDEIRVLADLIGDDLRRRLDERNRTVDRLNALATLLAGGGGALVVASSLLLLQRLRRDLTEPMHELSRVAERLGAGDLGARSSAAGVREVESVSSSVNHMAARLEQTVEDLRALDRLKSEFVSVVSHELRTPLTSIRGSIGLVAAGVMGEVPAEAKEMLDIAVTNTDRLVRLINDILDLERMDAGRMTYEPRDVPIADLLDEALSNVVGAAEAKGVELVVRPAAGTLHADPDRVVQALTNLLGNAVKFSSAGSVVELAAEMTEREVVLTVADQGRGIPPDSLTTVFDRFAQVDASDARELGGTGLGLAIVQQIARQHGGRTEVSSEVGVGSTFRVVLPSVASREAGPAALSDGARALVMVVEDDRLLRRVIATQLAQHGVEVAEAAGPAEAVAVCVERRPDVVVLDVRLEDSTGFDVVSALRSLPGGSSLPVVVYTAFPLDEEEVDRLRLGPTVVIQKDLRGAERLEAAVLDALGTSGGGADK